MKKSTSMLAATLLAVSTAQAGLVGHWPFTTDFSDDSGHGYDMIAGESVSVRDGHAVFPAVTDDSSWANGMLLMVK